MGRGAYKIVYKAIDQETGCEVAWNAIDLYHLKKLDKRRIKLEMTLISGMDHKNIIHFINCWENKKKEEIVFITEMITGGTLRSYIKKNKIIKLKVIK